MRFAFFPRSRQRALACGATALFCCALAACGGEVEEIVPEAYSPSSAWDDYRHGLQQAGLASTALGLEWRRVADAALASPVTVDLPYGEVGAFDAREAHAFGYRFEVARGQRIAVQLTLPGPAPEVFIDLFRLDDASAPVHVASADAAARTLVFEPRVDGAYVLRLQPELLRAATFELRVGREAALDFPVAGHDVGAIQSSFGAPRDAGRRSHHGVDIFAPRGTPAVAATRAYVRRVREQRLGGLTVWLHDEKRNLHLYYAHLDEQLVEPGEWVEPGQIVGRVGNTGNARTTPPHLHFAIYASGEGPINPDPFLRQPSRGLPTLRADPGLVGDFAVTDREIILRATAARRAGSIASLVSGTPVRVWAASAAYYRVALFDGTGGYLPADTVSSLSAAAND
jgi:murein DD-endopeptidase MepM/ murein hydrolase activator NlpD